MSPPPTNWDMVKESENLVATAVSVVMPLIDWTRDFSCLKIG